MRTARSSLIAALLAAAALTAEAGAQTCECPPVAEERVTIYADESPPPLPVYQQPPIPAPGYLWTPGYWAWNGYEYFWAPGVWVEPPRPGLLWTPGYWGFVGGIFAFHAGYWAEHVGFYGGVNYGFGFGGAGYQGGQWRNNQFFYNQTVNNIRNVHVTNVYNEQVTVNNVNVTRISYNGGPNGVAAKPTASELAVAKEAHVAPTPAQTHNASLASRNPSAFVSENKGKPPVAATARAGVFRGDAVVRASASGDTAPLATPRPQSPAANPSLEERKPAPPQPEPRRTEERKAEPAPKAEGAPKVDPAPKAEERELRPKPERPGPEQRRIEEKPPRPAPERREPPRAAHPAPPRAEPRPAPHPGGHEACGRPGEPACHR